MFQSRIAALHAQVPNRMAPKKWAPVWGEDLAPLAKFPLGVGDFREGRRKFG